MAVDMYLRYFWKPLIVTDHADKGNLKLLEQEAGDIVEVDGSCPADHTTAGLCCKTQKALAAMKDRIKTYKWFCYSDDDHYVAARNLAGFLRSQDSQKAQMFFSHCAKIH